MSKKHRRIANANYGVISTSGSGHQVAALSHEAEYRIIKLDLVKVVILNAVYLVLILFLYFENQKTGFLERWFADCAAVVVASSWRRR